jgi:hypothetical protein
MNIGYIRKLHNQVIHQEKAGASLRATYAEDRWIKKLNNNQLISVCKECFSLPR